MEKQGEGNGVIDFWRDIRGDEHLVSRVFDSVPAGVVIVDKAGRVHFFSAEAEQLFGYSAEEVVGQMVEMLMPERFRTVHSVLRNNFVKNPSRREMGRERILWARRKNGSEFPIEVGLGYTGRGDAMYISAVIIDISRRMAVEREREMLIDELKTALEKVKQLGGLLPICANCKKIRDDNGYWNQIEAYIRDHSEAEFSHSICPDCMHELYPELDNEE